MLSGAFRSRAHRLLSAALLATAAGCVGGGVAATSSGASGTDAASSGASSAAASSSGASSGGASTTNAGTTASGTATGGATSSGGSSSGGTTGPSTISTDAGYVFCTLPGAADAGPDGGPGNARWMCLPGTYFCDFSGNLGNCFQCRSDSDCADPSRPTFDPLRPRCDLDSGVSGYQNFCEVCLSDGDCASNPAGPLCNLNPTYPAGDLFTPELVDRGFEACGRLETDCRVDGGLRCSGPNRVCDPSNGRCSCQPVGSCGCILDSDCPAGQLCDLPAGALCVPEPQPCLPERCRNGSFCDWDSGLCRTDIGCLTSFDCFGGHVCNAQNQCAQCRDNADCARGNYLDQPYCCLPGDPTPGCGAPVAFCANTCNTDADCALGDVGPTCLKGQAQPRCGCGSDLDCQGAANGSHCDLDPSDRSYGACTCRSGADCAADQGCPRGGNAYGFCQLSCATDQDCGPGYFCSVSFTCQSRCDNGHGCQGSQTHCDSTDDAGHNGFGASGGAPGSIWCYECLKASDCPAGQGCSQNHCGSCSVGAQCRPGEVCDGWNRACQPPCSTTPCSDGGVCDTDNRIGLGEVCYGCLSPADCPGDEGCNSSTHTCGSCVYSSSDRILAGCPPGDVCTAFWGTSSVGACLASCDRSSCPADRPICATLPALTAEHAYCVGCVTDADCTDAGAGSWCDISVGKTFTCRPPPK